MEASREGYTASDDPARLDRDAIHAFISRSDWAAGIPRATLDRALDHSLCIGLYHGASQVGLARVVTDRATYAYLCDVYVDEAHRGRGLGKWLVGRALAHPHLQGLRRISLMTRDAQGLYQALGFQAMRDPSHYLQLHRPDVYKDAGGGTP